MTRIQVQHLAGIRRGNPSKLFGVGIARPGKRCQTVWQVFRAVTFTAVLRHGHVRRIRFQHERLHRKLPGKRTHFHRALKGQHATKAQPESHLDVARGLLQAAVKGMADAAAYRYTPQRCQHGVV